MRKLLFIYCCFLFTNVNAQSITVELNKNWEFSKKADNRWSPAIVPGCIYTDLYRNGLIPDPFFADNEKELQWVDSLDWEYRTTFDVNKNLLSSQNVDVCFDGLDTYTVISVNGHYVLSSGNMFRPSRVNIKRFLKEKNNQLVVWFRSSLLEVNRLAKGRLPVLPDNNRVYARKAQFQFGWDWGPKYISCGIWKKVSLIGYNGKSSNDTDMPSASPVATLVQKKDEYGSSFCFEKNGKPVYIKGANWIPANIFLASVTKGDYKKLLLKAKQANMNMLRVWGGGVYEDDYFYDLCDSLGIMVWQDFMFAGAMYPDDIEFRLNVKEEVRYQVGRLKKHPCIVLWCGNNEIDEAWHNWGWQDQFNIHGADSVKMWNNYKMLFEDSLKAWVNEFDGKRPYIPSSPKFGWGHEESFKEADSHYWGLWWGLEPWEAFEIHTGRFVSEYGMQSMPNLSTLHSYVPLHDFNYSSAAVQSHQKANEGFKKMNFYLDKYFIDSSKLKKLSLEEYSYLTQCLQYYILKNSIAVQRSKEPYNMGTLLWQLNDCWPVTSWSITDYSREPKAGWYAVKEAYRDDVKPTKDSIYPGHLKLAKPRFTVTLKGRSACIIESSTDAEYVFIDPETGITDVSENYFSLKAGQKKEITFSVKYSPGGMKPFFKFISLYDVLNKP